MYIQMLLKKANNSKEELALAIKERFNYDQVIVTNLSNVSENAVTVYFTCVREGEVDEDNAITIKEMDTKYSQMLKKALCKVCGPEVAEEYKKSFMKEAFGEAE